MHPHAACHYSSAYARSLCFSETDQKSAIDQHVRLSLLCPRKFTPKSQRKSTHVLGSDSGKTRIFQEAAYSISFFVDIFVQSKVPSLEHMSSASKHRPIIECAAYADCCSFRILGHGKVTCIFYYYFYNTCARSLTSHQTCIPSSFLQKIRHNIKYLLRCFQEGSSPCPIFSGPAVPLASL